MSFLQRLSFRAKLLATVGAACVFCGAISVAVAVYYNEVELHRGLVDKSRVIHGRLDVAARFVANQGGLKPIIDRYKEKYKSSDQLTDEDKRIILQQVPIYAAMKIGNDEAEKNHYAFRVFSNEPRNPDNAATPEELAIFKKFEEDPALKEWVSDNKEVVTVYRPVRLAENHGCLNCHGNPGSSPWGNGKDILGYKMEDWKDGKLHGVFAIKNNLAAVLKAEADEGGVSSTVMLALFICFGALAALLLSALVIKGPIDRLIAISATLSNAGDQVTAASSQIAESSEGLAQAATEQASSLQETASALEEITAMISRASDSANATAGSSVDSQNKAKEGRGSADEMLSAMDEINHSNEAIMNQINESNEKMAEIVKVIQEIGTKTKVINDIVFQTKLLSFNASVEAARAGEHGKGFAVVAEEIGNLAQMSGNAAKEISDMLESSVTKVEEIVQETRARVESLIGTGKLKVESGVRVARQCSTVLDEIVQNVNRVSGLAQEISQAAREQSQGVVEINKAMGHLDAVTQQNSASSEKAAQAAEGLSNQAVAMRNAVLELIQVVQGQQSHLESAHVAPTLKFRRRSRPPADDSGENAYEGQA